nr:hypothetical protein [Oscillospiraceae bacterium]
VMLFGVACRKPTAENQNLLMPFSVILVPDHLPATKAFLEYYASQIAWMDSSLLRCMILLYPDENPDAELLCRDMSREHEFFTACSVSQFREFLDAQQKNP